jgi:predicted tellurium resistance membrane protein TerC
MDILLDFHVWLSLISLTAIEIILGVDNLVFIAIVTSRLHSSQQKLARRIGLLMAMIMRLLLLTIIVWLAESTKPFMHLGPIPISLRSAVLFFGGLFLFYKAVIELLHMKQQQANNYQKKTTKFMAAIAQIMLFDMLFSLDSVITAVGIVDQYWIMVVAIIIAVLMMMLAAEPVTRFIMKYQRIKVLALCILVLVSIKLILSGLSIHVPSTFIFTAMGFAFFIELINIWLKSFRQ